MENIYDVIIVGAGPAGLSVASELSKDNKVLVVDKKKVVSETKKPWIISDLALRSGDAMEIKDLCPNRLTRFKTDTFTGGKICWDSFDKYYYSDERAILSYWADIIIKNGSDILLNSLYEDHIVKDDRVTVLISKKRYEARLIIDASGYDSLIKKQYNIKDKNDYWWSVYGAIIDTPKNEPEIGLGDYQLWQTFRDTNLSVDTSLANGRPVLEYEVLDEENTFVFIFYLRKYIINEEILEKEFEEIINKEESTRFFRNSKIKEVKYGWYPSGDANSQKIAKDRVAFIGDSACWTTPCGWGMTTILANYKHYAKALNKNLATEKLDQESLISLVIPNYYTKNQILMDKLVMHFLSNATPALLDKFINLFSNNGPLGKNAGLYCERTFTMNLTDADVLYMIPRVIKHFEIKELMDIMPAEDYLLMLKTGISFLESTFIEKLKKSAGHIIDIDKKEKLKNGFVFINDN